MPCMTVVCHGAPKERASSTPLLEAGPGTAGRGRSGTQHAHTPAAPPADRKGLGSAAPSMSWPVAAIAVYACIPIPPVRRRPCHAQGTVRELRGLVEMPSDRRFIVITVRIDAGFPAVEAFRMAERGTRGRP